MFLRHHLFLNRATNFKRRIFGFTLIEVLVAGFVFSIGVLGVITLQHRVLQYQRTALIRTDIAGIMTQLSELLRIHRDQNYSQYFNSDAKFGPSGTDPETTLNIGNQEYITDLSKCNLTSTATLSEKEQNFCKIIRLVSGSNPSTPTPLIPSGGFLVRRLDAPSSSPSDLEGLKAKAVRYDLLAFWRDKDATTTSQKCTDDDDNRSCCPAPYVDISSDVKYFCSRLMLSF